MTTLERFRSAIKAAYAAAIPALIAACICQAAGEGGRRAANASCSGVDTFSVLFYNVENLFDMNDDGGEYPEYTPFHCNWSWDTYRIKLGNIASVIEAANAQIVALVEVENRNVLEELRKKLRTRRINYPYIALGDFPNKTNVCPAILSRYPIAHTTGFPGPKTAGYVSRNILEADIRIGEKELKVFVNHWPSKQHPESTRIEAAKVLRNRLAALPPGTDYIIVGDMNANYNECETFKRKTKLNDTEGKTAINHILGTLEPGRSGNEAFASESSLCTASGFRQYNLWMELPQEQRMSYLFRKSNETPDNFLLPYSLYDTAGFSYADNSFSAFTWNGKLINGKTPFSWQTTRVAGKPYHTGKGFSDHLPIYAKFVCGPFKKAPRD